MSTQPSLPGIPKTKPSKPLAAPRKKERTSGNDITGPAADPGGTLPMFRTAADVKKNFQPNPFDFGANYSGRAESDKSFWETKRKEARGSGLTKRLQRDNGVVERPLHLGVEPPTDWDRDKSKELHSRPLKDKPMILGGHHRIASMMDINPQQFMPVMYHERNAETYEGPPKWPIDSARFGKWQAHYDKGYT